MEINEISLHINVRREQAQADITASIAKMDSRLHGMGINFSHDDDIVRKAKCAAVHALLGAKIQLEELLELNAPTSEFACIQMRMGCCEQGDHTDE